MDAKRITQHRLKKTLGQAESVESLFDFNNPKPGKDYELKQMYGW